MRPLEGTGGVRPGFEGRSAAKGVATVKSGETKLADVAARLGIDPDALRRALIKELQTAFASMPEDMRRQFHDAVAASLAVSPKSWLAEIHR